MANSQGRRSSAQRMRVSYPGPAADNLDESANGPSTALVPVVGSVVPLQKEYSLWPQAKGIQPMAAKKAVLAGDEKTVAEREALAMIERAKAVVVATDADSEAATAIVREIKARKARWLELVDPLVKSAAENHKKAVALRDSMVKPLDEAKALVECRQGSFLAEQRRLRAEAEAVAQAEAQRQAEAEREAEIEALQASGQDEAAQAVAAEPVQAPVVIAAPVYKPQGVSTTEVWHYEIVAPAAIPRDYLMVNDPMIGKVVRAMKGQTKIPGVRVWKTDEVRTRA